MKPTTSPSPLRLWCTSAVAAVMLFASLGLFATTAQAADEKKLPVTTTFEKTDTEDAPPYVLHVRNTAASPLKVKATVLLSVVAHNMDKARQVPEHEIAPGATWTIEELAAQDKVTLKADGYAPLELVVK